jgi:hypothetical protein
MTPVFVLLADEGPSMSFVSEDEATTVWWSERPILSSVLRAVSTVYRQERIDTCRAVDIAKDIESSLRKVSGNSAVTVRAMKYVTTETKIMNGRSYAVQELREIAAR